MARYPAPPRLPAAQPSLRDLLNAPPCPTFDRIVRLAAHAVQQPYAAISLTDAASQRFIARLGPVPVMLPAADAPCSRVVEAKRPLAFPSLLAHPTFRNGLLARHGIRFYVGAPLLTAEGSAIGALCVMGSDPYAITPEQVTLLTDAAALVMAQVELRQTGGRIDRLSGLPNRSQFFEEMEDLARREPGRARIIALVDLARPDELAHMLRTVGSAGLDDIIRRDAARLRTRLAPTTRLFHVAPTQFVLLTPPESAAAAVTATLQDEIGRTAADDATAAALLSTGCTAGIATVTPGDAPPVDLLRRAHAALDDARRRRAPIGVYAPEQDGAHRRALTLLHDFEDALCGHPGLRLMFQPRLELATGRCVAVEALLRWKHPYLGEIGPAEFVPLVEKTGMARPMMRWVLASALAQLCTWREAGLLLHLSVNVSPANLGEPDFARHVIQTLAETGLPPGTLELEITESALLDDHSPEIQQLNAISAAGIRIAIDDFGTGYSSLSYLQRLPADVVKIDQSFIRGLTLPNDPPETSIVDDEGRRRTLVTAMIALSHDLGYHVVAEGIETKAAADMLLSLECDEVQGYFYARPMAPAAFEAWHIQHQWQSTPPPRPAHIRRKQSA